MNRLFRKFICAGLTAVMLSTAALTASAATVTDFKDVSPNAWYYNAVDYAASNGLFSGTGKNTFSPDVGMTRGMFVTVLGRKSGVPDTDPASTSFSDVKTTDWFAPYVEWAAANKIVSGTGNGKFSPNDKISRQQMATILYRYAQQTGNDTSVDPSIFNAFPDKGNVAGYAVQGMRWAASHGIIKGSGGRLDPTATATRAQVAQVFLNAKDILTKTAVAEPEPGESHELAAIRQYLDQNLPEVCQWSEDALQGGWVGAILLNDGGWWRDKQYFGIEYVAKYCEYLLTEYHGTMENAFATAQTFEDGTFILKDIPFGKWLVVELETLPGYVLLKDPVTVEITEDGQKITLDPIQNEYTKVEISKQDMTTGKELPGAKLQLFDSEGKLIEEWVSTDTPHLIERLPAGKYRLHEETAPAGFTVAEDVEFTVEETGEIQKVVMKDAPVPTTPNTGENQPIVWVSGLFFLAFAGAWMVALLLCRQRKKEKNER